MVWGSFLIAAAALKTPTRSGHNTQGVNLTFAPQVRWRLHSETLNPDGQGKNNP